MRNGSAARYVDRSLRQLRLRERAAGTDHEQRQRTRTRATRARAESGPGRHGRYIGLRGASLKLRSQSPARAGRQALMATLGIRSEVHGGIPALALSGELDFAGLDLLESELAPLERGSPPILILDLKELSFLDSSGLNIIVQANRRAADEGRRLVIVRGDHRVQRVFEWTGVTRSLEFVDSVEELPEAG